MQYTGKDGKLEYVWGTSWGVSTRLISGLIMAHSDDDGLVLPEAGADSCGDRTDLQNEEELTKVSAAVDPIVKGFAQAAGCR